MPVLLVLALLAARTLSWNSLEVDAKLDAQGELRVSERHRMLFNGDWNGGERKFRVPYGQQLDLISVSRVDTAGNVTPLRRAGSAPELDEYIFDGSTLRWRARRVSDPPFRNRELTYVIDYTMRNVVAREGDHYSLKHDFAFADRPGVIEQYTLNIALDPAWDPAPGFEPTIQRIALPPGDSVHLDVPLIWKGEGQPAFLAAERAPVQQTVEQPAGAVEDTRAPTLPLTISGPALLVFLLVAALMYFAFLRREESVRRYDPDPDVTPEWLEKNLLPYRAEVVGESWDRQTGQAEVAALLAIMATEGKIENIPGNPPRMKLLVPRESLSEYEYGFVDRLFITGDEIDRDTLRKHYRETGFDPSEPLKKSLYEASQQLVGDYAGCSGGVKFVIGMIIACGAIPLLAAANGERGVMGVSAIIAFFLTFCFVVAYGAKNGSRPLAPFLILPLVILGGTIAAFATATASLAALLVLTVILMWLALSSAGWRGTADHVRMMRNFRAAQKFFKRYLEGPGDLDERWIPYILAFGLGPALDQWFVAAPVQSNAPQPQRRVFNGATRNTSGTSSTPVASAPFGGGGGRFGGAGATGGWAASINSFAASVPRPAPPRSSSSGSSSSSWSGSSRSSSSSSSGSSRSGGGGGGGW